MEGAEGDMPGDPAVASSSGPSVEVPEGAAPRARRGDRGAFLLGALLLTIVGTLVSTAYTVHALREAEGGLERAARSQEVLADIGSLLGTALGAESSRQAWLLSGREEFATRREEQQEAARACLRRLESIRGSAPGWSRRTREIGEFLAGRSEPGIAVPSRGFPELLEEARRCQLRMDGLRTACEELAVLERAEGPRRDAAVLDAMESTTIALGLLVGCGVGALLLGITALRRNLLRRRRIDERFRALNRELRREAERARRMAEERDRFFNLSPEPMAVAGTDGRFRRLNPAWEATLGWTPEQLSAVPYLEFVHPEDREATLREASRLASGLTTVRFENRYRAKDGGYRWLSWKARTAGPGEEWIYATARDITLRKQVETELVAAREKAEEAREELEAFSHAVSHDLRAPLRSIHGFAGAILEDEAPRLSLPARGHFRRIQEAARRMDALVGDLLRLSRVSRAELLRQPVDLGLLAGEVVADLRSREPGRVVEFRTKGPLRVEGDARLLRVALDNLLANAWKFTAGRERAVLVLSGEGAGGMGRFTVSDNGAGFDMEKAGRMFEPFQRLHAQSEFPGTGVGLATVARVIRRHGGTVGAEGAPGRGAAVWFTLPLVSPDEGPAADAVPLERQLDFRFAEV